MSARVIRGVVRGTSGAAPAGYVADPQLLTVRLTGEFHTGGCGERHAGSVLRTTGSFGRGSNTPGLYPAATDQDAQEKRPSCNGTSPQYERALGAGIIFLKNNPS